jgi:hypothetical protein
MSTLICVQNNEAKRERMLWSRSVNLNIFPGKIVPWLDGVRHSESLTGNIWRWGWICQNPDVCELWQLRICLSHLALSLPICSQLHWLCQVNWRFLIADKNSPNKYPQNVHENVRQDFPRTVLVQFITLMSWISVQQVIFAITGIHWCNNALEIFPAKFLPNLVRNW